MDMNYLEDIRRLIITILIQYYRFLQLTQIYLYFKLIPQSTFLEIKLNFINYRIKSLLAKRTIQVYSHYQLINFIYDMSYYYPYVPYYRYPYSVAASIEVEGALRRSRLAADLAVSRAATESALRRSRIEAEIATENVLRRSRIEAEVAADSALRRSRVAAEIQAERYETQAVLRRSRVEAEIAADRLATQSVLRRSRVQAQIVADEAALRRSRIEAEIATDSILRRSRLAADIEASRYRRLYYPYI